MAEVTDQPQRLDYSPAGPGVKFFAIIGDHQFFICSHAEKQPVTDSPKEQLPSG